MSLRALILVLSVQLTKKILQLNLLLTIIPVGTRLTIRIRGEILGWGAPALTSGKSLKLLTKKTI